MIHEYALEPELVASWHERILFRFVIEQFGFGTGRLVSRYPRKWRKLVWQAFEGAFGGTAGETDRTRIAELLKQLTMPEVRRPGHLWDDARGWLENAEQEHARQPFHAILARENPRSQPSVLCADDVLNGTPAAWIAPSSLVVDRTAEAMAQCVAPMLLCATQILFVDPHFRASRPKFRNPMARFLQIVASVASEIRIEIHTGDIADNSPDWITFRRECEGHLPAVVPAGLELVVRRWKHRAGGDRLHNRYILTDIGGVQFGVGLDEGDPGTTDDITLLHADAYRRRLEDFVGPALAFDLEGEVRISGRASG